jgi:hypothetical protein
MKKVFLWFDKKIKLTKQHSNGNMAFRLKTSLLLTSCLQASSLQISYVSVFCVCVCLCVCVCVCVCVIVKCVKVEWFVSIVFSVHLMCVSACV